MPAKQITFTIFGEDQDDLNEMISDVAERLCCGDIKGESDLNNKGYTFEMKDTEMPEIDDDCTVCAGTGEGQYDGARCFACCGTGANHRQHHQHH